MIYRAFPLLLTALLLSACAGNVERSSPEVVSLGEYRQFLAELRQEIHQADPPLLEGSELERYNQIERRIFTHIDGVDDVDEMSHREQTELFNLHESLWATLRGRDDDQMVCRRVSQVGTNFRRTTCRSLGEIRASQRNTQVFMDNLARAPETND
jgi:hypothetical protein